MKTINELSPLDAKRFEVAATHLAAIKKEARLVNEYLAPYKDLYYDTQEDTCFPIGDGLLESEYGIGPEFMLWLSDHIELLEHLAVVAKMMPAINQAMRVTE